MGIRARHGGGGHCRLDLSPSLTHKKLLHKNVDSDHWVHLFVAWSSDRVPRHRVWACELAQRFGGRSVLPALKALKADIDGHVQRAAMQAAEHIGVA